MAQRHEEKYILSLADYWLLRARAQAALQPDPNGESYLITSLYFDDPLDSALDEKLEGLPEHSKFRIRTYNGREGLIRLERKDKRGILTHKQSAPLTRHSLGQLLGGEDPGGPAGALAAQIRAAALQPTVTVRYRRDAYCWPGSDLRLTFDTCLEALGPEECHLFDPSTAGIPALHRGSVIMEIKYGSHLPAFIRKLTDADCTQLSVSKYALCRTLEMI